MEPTTTKPNLPQIASCTYYDTINKTNLEKKNKTVFARIKASLPSTKGAIVTGELPYN